MQLTTVSTVSKCIYVYRTKFSIVLDLLRTYIWPIAVNTVSKYTTICTNNVRRGYYAGNKFDVMRATKARL